MDVAAFVLAHTRLQPAPFVPELRLHLAEDIEQLWSRTQHALADPAAPPPYWAFAWLGGQAVARYLLDTPAEVAGRDVLDLGSGSGICALAALRAGARCVTAADVDPLAGAALALNAAAGAASVTYVRADLLAAEPPPVPVLLAGDLCYDVDLAARVVPWLRRAAQQGSRVLLGDPGRHYLPRTGLDLLAEYDVPTTRALEGLRRRRARVFRLRPR